MQAKLRQLSVKLTGKTHVSTQESLRKITNTLTLKNEEISNFVSTLKQSLDNLEVTGDAGNVTPCRVTFRM